MAEALDGHELLDVDRAVGADPPEVVATEVDEHHVLGALLRVLGELAREPLVLGVGAPARPRPGDRAHRGDAVAEADERLGRGAEHGAAVEAHEVEVRARVEDAQRAVDGERRRRRGAVEPLGEDDLEHVARDDVLLARPRPRRGSPPRCGSGSSRRRQRGARRAARRARATGAAARAADELVEPRAGRVVACRELGVVEPATGDVHEHGEPLAPVVEREELADQVERGVGVAEVVDGWGVEPLDLADDVVGEHADEAGVQRREARERGVSVRGEHALEVARARPRRLAARAAPCGRGGAAGACAGTSRGRWRPTKL